MSSKSYTVSSCVVKVIYSRWELLLLCWLLISSLVHSQCFTTTLLINRGFTTCQMFCYRCTTRTCRSDTFETSCMSVCITMSRLSCLVSVCIAMSRPSCLVSVCMAMSRPSCLAECQDQIASLNTAPSPLYVARLVFLYFLVIVRRLFK